MSKKDDKRRKRAKAKAKARAGSTLPENRPGYENPQKVTRRAMAEAARAERVLMEKRKAERECGDCQLCCELKAVSADDQEVRPTLPYAEAEASKWKVAWTRCEHQCATGCAIYDQPEKPSACGGYVCLWREGWGTDEERPDRLGVLPEVDRNAAYQRIGEGATTHGQVLVFRADSSVKLAAIEKARHEFVGKGGTVVTVTPQAQTIYGPRCKKGVTFSTAELARLHDQALDRRATP